MPCEMITLQLGQCGNQSKISSHLCYPGIFALFWHYFVISRFRILETPLCRAWYQPGGNFRRICCRRVRKNWRNRSERCLLLSGIIKMSFFKLLYSLFYYSNIIIISLKISKDMSWICFVLCQISFDIWNQLIFRSISQSIEYNLLKIYDGYSSK